MDLRHRAASVFTFAFIPLFVILVVSSCISAFGEELGWRGLLVPELSRLIGFTQLALLSAAIWAVWHFPISIFGSYHGAGPVWFSLVTFTPAVIGAGVILAWLRLKSGSVWLAVLFHEFWNFFIQKLCPVMTKVTPGWNMMLGEFGWAVAIIALLFAVGFWYFRNRLTALEKGIPTGI